MFISYSVGSFDNWHKQSLPDLFRCEPPTRPRRRTRRRAVTHSNPVCEKERLGNWGVDVVLSVYEDGGSQ